MLFCSWTALPAAVDKVPAGALDLTNFITACEYCLRNADLCGHWLIRQFWLQVTMSFDTAAKLQCIWHILWVPSALISLITCPA